MIALLPRCLAAVVLTGVGIGLAASPEIGGLVSVGFVCFVAGVAFVASALVDVLGVE
jgi:hypothetical protein